MAGGFQLPTISSTSTSKGTKLSAPFSYTPSSPHKSHGLTARQYAILMYAKSHKQHKSLGSRLLHRGMHDSLGAVGWTLDKLMRPSWGVTSGLAEGLTHERSHPLARAEGFAHGFGQGFMGHHRIGFGQLEEAEGVLPHHKRLRGLTGFGLDVFTDPTMYVTLGGATPYEVGARGTYAAAKAGGHAVEVGTFHKAAREAGHRAIQGEYDALDEEILHAAGDKYTSRLALLRQNKVRQNAQGLEIPAAGSEQHLLQRAAKAEELMNEPRKLAVTLAGVKKITTPIPVLPRAGARLANKGIPVASSLAELLGKAFVPGFRNDVYHSMELGRTHAAEYNNVSMLDEVRKIMGGMDGKLSSDEQRHALHYYETPLNKKWKPVLEDKRTERFYANDKYLAHLVKLQKITPAQADYIKRYNLATNTLLAHDVAHGVEVRDYMRRTGRGYVPHVLKSGKDIKPTVYQKGYTVPAGFEHGRDADVSLQTIHRWVKEGKLPRDVESDPMIALTRRTRASAERQADMSLLNAMKLAVGRPTRIVDRKKVASAEARVLAAQAHHEGATRLAAVHEQAYQDAVAGRGVEFKSTFDKALKKGLSDIKAFKSAAKKKQMDELEAKLKRARKPERKAEIEKQIKRIKFGTVKTPEVATIMATLDEVKGHFEKALKAIANPRTNDHKKLFAAEMDALKGSKLARKDAKDELRRANNALKQAKAGTANKNIPVHYVDEKRITDEFGNLYRMPPEASNSILKLERLVSGEDTTVESFTRSVGKWIGAWKIMVTVVNPGYRFRNTMTDFWNMWLAGVPTWAIGAYGKRSAQLLRGFKKYDPKALKWIQEATDHGIMSGLFAGDVQQVAQMMRYSKSKRALTHDKKFIRLYTKVAQDLNRNAENWGRLTHYMYRREALKESAAEAAFHVRMAHFDYEELTPFEQKVMKNIFPFYTWSRKNIPYQVKKIFQAPGRYAAFPKAVQESEYASGNKNENIPGYAEQALAFQVPIGKHRFYLPQTGVSDLEVFEGPGAALDRVKSLIGPQEKIPFELLSNKNLFSGQPIVPDNRSRVPVSGLGAKFLSLLPGSNVGTTARAGMKGPGANPYYAYALGQLPMTGFLGVRSGGIKAKQNPYGAMASYLGGQTFLNVDPKTEALYEQLGVEAAVDKSLQDLRDEGVLPTRKRKKTHFDKQLQAMLRGNYGPSK